MDEAEYFGLLYEDEENNPVSILQLTEYASGHMCYLEKLFQNLKISNKKFDFKKYLWEASTFNSCNEMDGKKFYSPSITWQLWYVDVLSDVVYHPPSISNPFPNLPEAWKKFYWKQTPGLESVLKSRSSVELITLLQNESHHDNFHKFQSNK